MSNKEILSHAFSDNLDQMKTLFSNEIAEKLSELMNQKKQEIAQNYFGQKTVTEETIDEDEIDEGTVQKQKADFRSDKHRYGPKAPHMYLGKFHKGTYMTGEGSYDDKDETKISHGVARQINKKLAKAGSKEEKEKLSKEFWKKGTMSGVRGIPPRDDGEYEYRDGKIVKVAEETIDEDEIDEGTVQKHKNRYGSKAPHMYPGKYHKGTYATGEDGYDDGNYDFNNTTDTKIFKAKDQTKISHGVARKMNKKIGKAGSAEEKIELDNKFYRTGKM